MDIQALFVAATESGIQDQPQTVEVKGDNVFGQFGLGS